jgi:GNAT superfamily N-acetyltransferase
LIQYHDSMAGMGPETLEGFFDGWPRSPTLVARWRILCGSAERVLAVDDETGRVVGFVTAISDRMFCASIPLLEVLPQYRRRGIGRELMRRMLEKLRGLYMVDLVCDPQMQPFYESLGMKPLVAMTIRNPDVLSEPEVR